MKLLVAIGYSDDLVQALVKFSHSTCAYSKTTRLNSTKISETKISSAESNPRLAVAGRIVISQVRSNRDALKPPRYTLTEMHSDRDKPEYKPCIGIGFARKKKRKLHTSEAAGHSAIMVLCTLFKQHNTLARRSLYSLNIERNA